MKNINYSLIVISILLFISILTIIIMYLYCFRCKIIDASHNDMFKSYNLDPLVDAYSWLSISDPCISFKKMYDNQRKQMIRLFGNPQNNISKFNIRTIMVDKKPKIRVFPVNKPKGICIFIHGGGWAIGSYDEQDPTLHSLAMNTRQTVCSLSYPLLHESENNKYPVGVDECTKLSDYILNNLNIIEPNLRKNPVFTICGNSAGAQLALVVILRLKKSYGYCPFNKASFFYGGFMPLYTTPPCLKENKYIVDNTIGMIPPIGKDYKFLTVRLYERFQRAYSTDYLNPEVNLSLADLKNLCPAQFIVGTEDLLLSANIILYNQWRFFNNEGQLKIFVGQPHAFSTLPTPSGMEANILREKYLRHSKN